MQEVNVNVTESSEVSRNVAEEIAGLNQAASEIRKNSSEVDGNASRLSQLADNFARLVGTFRV